MSMTGKYRAKIQISLQLYEMDNSVSFHEAELPLDYKDVTMFQLAKFQIVLIKLFRRIDAVFFGPNLMRWVYFK